MVCRLPPVPAHGHSRRHQQAIARVSAHLGGRLWDERPLLLGEGDVYQFGVASGNSLVSILASAYRGVPATRIWAFDSFDGVPAEDAGEYTGWKAGVYRQSDTAAVVQRLTRAVATLGGNVTFIRGLFAETRSRKRSRVRRACCLRRTSTWTVTSTQGRSKPSSGLQKRCRAGWDSHRI